jgi:tRNA threonylcarbamoyladenosine dehydratase
MNVFNFNSHKTQLIATALAASFVTAGLLSGYTSYNKSQRRKDLDQEILRSVVLGSSGNEHKASPPTQSVTSSDPDHLVVDHGIGYNEELIKEQLARNYAFFGEEEMSKVRAGSVVIVGCGGVGSWAAVMLVRS